MNEFVEKLDMKVLGERLQKVRQHLKLKQADVAKELGCASLTISRMERGEPTNSTVSAIIFYSLSVDMNMLLSADFDPDDDALYSKNPALQSHVKARLRLLEEDARDYIADMQKDFDENVKKIIQEYTEKMFQKLNERMLKATQKQNEDLFRRLEQTIELL